MLAKTKENIRADFQSLMGSFDKKIAELAQNTRQNNEINQTAINELNKLKLERTKLKQNCINIEGMTEVQVLEQQNVYEKHYNNAIDLLGQPSETM